MNTSTGLGALLTQIDPQFRVLIQTHDFPDFDAIAAAFGLAKLLEKYGCKTLVVYAAEIQSFSLDETIRSIRIPLVQAKNFEPALGDQILLVDSLPGNKNVTLVEGTLKGVIDHHPAPGGPSTDFWDVRPAYGSCSTIIHEYIQASGFPVSKPVATALLMGIMMDTNYLTRGVNQADLDAFNALYFKGDWIMGNYLLKNSLTVMDRQVFIEAMEKLRVHKGFGFSFLTQETSVETIALIADDYLRFHEVHFMVCCAYHQGDLKISVRSEDPGLSAGLVARLALEGLGFGGGHMHMGGGKIDGRTPVTEDELFERFKGAIHRLVHEPSIPTPNFQE